MREIDGRALRYSRELDEEVGDRRRLQIGAHEAYGIFISELSSWDTFVTGTYDPRLRLGGTQLIGSTAVSPGITRWKAMRDAQRFWEFACELVGCPVDAVLSVEPHDQSDSYHMHGVMRLGEPVDAYRNALEWRWRWLHGFCRVRGPRHIGQVSSYVGKHLTGPRADVWFSPGLKS
jgi:hypothetical protein